MALIFRPRCRICRRCCGSRAASGQQPAAVYSSCNCSVAKVQGLRIPCRSAPAGRFICKEVHVVCSYGWVSKGAGVVVYLLREVCGRALRAGSYWLGTSRSHSQIWAPEADCCQPLPHLSDGAGRQPVPPACRPGFHQLDFEPPSRCRCRCSGRHRAATVWLREVSRGKRHGTTVDHRRSRRSRLPSNAAGAATLDPRYAGAATERSQPCGPMSKPRRVWPASAARAADLPMLPEA